MHNEYNHAESIRAIQRRYKRLKALLRYSLPRLLQFDEINDLWRTLVAQGWKDWHILTAMASIRANYLLALQMPGKIDDRQQKEAIFEFFQRDEKETDPEIPKDSFTESAMKFALKTSQMSTLELYGFKCSQRTPNFVAIDELLRRFNYWTDDVDHDPIVLKPVSEKSGDVGVDPAAAGE